MFSLTIWLKLQPGYEVKLRNFLKIPLAFYVNFPVRVYVYLKCLMRRWRNHNVSQLLKTLVWARRIKARIGPRTVIQTNIRLNYFCLFCKFKFVKFFQHPPRFITLDWCLLRTWLYNTKSNERITLAGFNFEWIGRGGISFLLHKK